MLASIRRFTVKTDVEDKYLRRRKGNRVRQNQLLFQDEPTNGVGLLLDLHVDCRQQCVEHLPVHILVRVDGIAGVALELVEKRGV